MRLLLYIGLLWLSHGWIVAQMWDGQDTLYGPEWIVEDQVYYKISVGEDGLHRISGTDLRSTGMELERVDAQRLRLYHMGKEIPLWISTEDLRDGSDLVWYGERNRGALDRHLYQNPDEQMLNPEYSLYSDISSYYLTVSDDPGMRYKEFTVDLDPELERVSEYKAVAQMIFCEHVTQDFRVADGVQLSLSRYDNTEGFGTGWVGGQGRPHTINLSTDDRIDGRDAELVLRLSSNEKPHRLRVSLNDVEILSDDFSGIELKEYIIPVISSLLEDENEIKIEGVSTSEDRYAIAYASLKYDAELSTERWPQSGLSLASYDSAVVISCERPEGTAIRLFDPQSLDMWNVDVEDDRIEFLIKNHALPGKLLLDDGRYQEPIAIEKKELKNFQDVAGDFVIITHGKFAASANEYAEYRSSDNGGSYKVDVVLMEDLYDSYAYGVHRHPLGIRNFAHHHVKNNPDTKHFLLLGKGREYDLVRKSSDDEGDFYYVPTMGLPGGDNLLFSDNYTHVPIKSFGRLAVTEADQVTAYLDKLKFFESDRRDNLDIESRRWKKEVLHLSGGGDEAAIIRPSLNILRDIISSNGYGAMVKTVDKQTPDAVQQSIPDQIISSINSGVGIKTFFGHGAINTTDFGLDNPEIFDNEGKYPLMFSLGCLSGNLHTDIISVSEKFVLAEERGAIGYIASSGFGFVSSLRILASEFYDLLGGEMYTASIGELMQASLAAQGNSSLFSVRLLSEQFTYHGDPAVRLHLQEDPDFVVDYESLKIEESDYSSVDEEITLSFDLLNLGKVIADSLDITIDYYLPESSEGVQIRKRVGLSGFRQNVSCGLPLFGARSVGVNRIEIDLDPEDRWKEGPEGLGEENNQLLGPSSIDYWEFFVDGERLRAFYPMDFAIINQSEITVRAEDNVVHSEPMHYQVIIDTTARFDSPLLDAISFQDQGGLIERSLDIDLMESVVYYWKIRSVGNRESEVHSFLYDPSRGEGWNQSHYFQFLEDDFVNLELADTSRRFRFVSRTDYYQVNSVNTLSPTFRERTTLFVNGNRIAANYRLGPEFPSRSKISVVVQDPVSDELWVNPVEGRYGSENSNRDRTVFYFPTYDAEKRASLIRFLRDTIPSGHIVHILAGIWDGNSLFTEDWSSDDTTAIADNLYRVLESQGATLINDMKLRGTVPYVFCYRKDQGIIHEEISPSIDQNISAEYRIQSPVDQGGLKSTVIGPVIGSKTLRISSLEVGDDQSEILIQALMTPDGAEVAEMKILEEIVDLDTTELSDLSYFTLNWSARDTADRTAPQLANWSIEGSRAGDLAFALDDHFLKVAASQDQGEIVSTEFMVKNIGSGLIESTLAQVSLRDERNQTTSDDVIIPSLEPGESALVSVEIASGFLEGRTALIIELNADRKALENYYSNNTLVQVLNLSPDELPPVLNVSFDGRVIEDGEVVSIQPQIRFELEDLESNFLLEDEALIYAYIVKSDGSTIELNESNLLGFDPAISLDDNRARWTYAPLLDADQEYVLIVNGRDVGDTRVDEIDRKIGFVTKSDLALSSLVASPAITSGQVRFMYYYQGIDQPDQFEINIYDSKGVLVKIIRQEDFGPLYGGFHLSRIFSTTSDAGELLPPGLYHFEVIAIKAEQRISLIIPDERFVQSRTGKFIITPSR